ncbi:MAG: Hsp20/alpha crystallin family protein [Spirochaetota bacterium]|nr:Hsp20/alpha crystallin family protein [Spirochaetota bacterium]
MELTKWRNNNLLEPMDEFDRLQDEINKLFDWTYPSSRGLFDRSLSPAVDIVETGDEIVLTCDLPGVRRDDLDLSISRNVITIKGEKKGEQEKEGAKTFRKETWSGSFQRTLSLPETVDPDKVDASMKDGVLTVKIAKREEVKPRQISVNVK